MGPLLLVLLYPLPCVSGLPFYNGFYYSNNPNGWNLGNGHGEGIFNGVKLVVETPEETLFSHRGANATLPCRYHYEPALLSPRPVRVKWWKLSENGAPEQDVLVAIGRRHRSFGDYRGRVRLRRDEERQVSLQIRDLRLEDSGRYRCEVIDGLEDESGLVELELRGVVFPYQHPRGRYQLSFHEAQRACVEQDAVVASFEQLFRAWEEGLDWCNAGWLQDASVQYPITRVRQPCGGLGLAPGVRSYGPRHHRLHRYDAFCFAPALRGVLPGAPGEADVGRGGGGLPGRRRPHCQGGPALCCLEVPWPGPLRCWLAGGWQCPLPCGPPASQLWAPGARCPKLRLPRPAGPGVRRVLLPSALVPRSALITSPPPPLSCCIY
ncbi:hyaluronan and proteoglycan link protein 3 isoform X2 [Ailuropoda melanoleuca]|uniref:hyaluronan and proteoglycan link protein 3 isoform X2 n=1 Tax=Ailuropoda melanoleuca TaxID=9646 RepID=UPI0014949E1C|nr:hyaluronan and proteoglycan link protein 3 isoform X2 [Ailuropoda melanoleuca]